MLQGHGSSKPIGMFIADGGSSSDLESNYLLSGYSKKTLQSFCTEVGLNYNDFYNTALIKEKIITHEANEGIWQINSKLINKVYEETLSNEIQTLKPYLLVPLGEVGFRWLTGQRGIRKFRGSVLPAINEILLPTSWKVLPILGPSPYLNKEYSLRAVTRIDFQKIKQHVNDSPLPDNKYNTWVCRTAQSLRNFLDRSYAAAPSFLVFDIESSAGLPTCISFCFDGKESVCIPFLDRDIDIDNRSNMLHLVGRVLASNIPKVNQNIKYDWKILERWRLHVNNVVGDTALAASCIYPEFPKNLGFLTSIYTDIPYFKDEGREFDPSKHKKEQFYLYNAKDSLATSQIYTQQIQEVGHFGTVGIYQQLIKLMPIYRRMEDRGILLDEEKRSSLKAKYESLYEIQLLKLRKQLGGAYCNPLSPKQCGKVIFEDMGFTKIPGVKGTDEKSLEMLIAYGEARRAPVIGKLVCQSIMDARKVQKVREMIAIPPYPDGRFRGEYNLGGTENGRTSSSGSIDQYLYIDDKGKIDSLYLGHSLQTIGKHGFQIDGVDYGKDIRSMFVADKGWIFCGLDRSQAEARVDAILSGNFEILKVFDSKVGIHRLTGSWVYKCKPEDIQKNTLIDGYDRYHISKIVRHAAERNMKEYQLMMLTRLPLPEAKRVLETFHNAQPEIRGVFHKDIRRIVSDCRRLVCPNGRHRMFFDRLDDHLYNEAISFLPQAIVSDNTKVPLIELEETCPWAKPVQEAHDGVLFLVPKGREAELIEKGKKAMETEIDFNHCSLKRDYKLVIPTEVEVGESWGTMEEVK